ncbi:MAG: hypothetical protein ACYSOT_03155, partial [Planctomycetota bacterium]
VLLGTLISMGMSMMHIGMLYKHFPFARFLLHAATTGFYFLAGAGMGMLILTQISGRSLAKPLAAVTLLVTIILGGLIFISYGTNAGIFRSIGSAAMSFGYLAILAAELLFLLAWLKQKPLPPEAGVIDPSPEPVPTLSTKAELPEL